MWGKRKTVLLLCLTISTFQIWSQQLVNHYVDSILSLEISHSEKLVQVENYLKSLSSDTPNLEDAYYSFARWNMVYNDDSKRAQLYGKKERVLRLQKYPATDDKTKKNLYNLGYFHYYAESPDYWAAKSYYDTLVSVSEDHEIRSGKAYRELGNIYNHWGDFQNALEHYQQSQQILKSAGRPDQELITLINTLANYVDLNDGTYLNDFLEVRKKIDSLNGVNISTSRKAKILHNTAAMFQIANKLEAASESANRALPLFKELQDSANVFNSLGLLGVIDIKNKDFAAARTYFDQAHVYARNDKIYLSNISNNLGDLELRSGNYEEALDHYYDAISWVIWSTKTPNKRLLPSITEISISPHKKRLFGYLRDLSKAWISYYKLNKKKEYLEYAESSLTLADTTIDELFLESQEIVSKLTWRKRASNLYMDAIEVAYDMKKPERALYFMEKNKGLLLLENTVDVLAKQRANISRTAIEKEEALLFAIKKGQLSLSNASSEKLEAIKKDLFSLKNQYRKFIDSLELLYPVYVSSKKQLNISSLQSIRKGLKKNEQVVSYALGDSLGYTLLISNNEIQLQKIPLMVPELNKRIDQFQKTLIKPFNTPEDISTFKVHATDLFQTLLPFEGFSDNLSQKSLVIIPDGIIQKVPFEALIVSANLKIPDAYLISKCNIAYKYSHSLDAQIAQLRHTGNSSAVGFLPIHFQEEYLETLSGSTKEAAMIRPYYKDRIYTLQNASKQEFLNQFDQNSIIHISTHGGTDIHGPWLGFYDSKLRLEELYFLKNRKELIVLSACKTDVGDIKKGEGVFSIKRGFFKAGARSVVSTLWDVNEKSSMEIINEFYKEMGSGKSKSEALRNAKLFYLNKYGNTSDASPYYWSAITLTGHDGPINLGNSSGFSWWIILLLFLILILFFSAKKLFRK